MSVLSASGVPSDLLLGMFSDQPPTMEEMTALLATQEPIHEPGEWWAYSNPGVTVLGHLAQEASRLPFADAVAERVFAPCGLEATTWDFTAAIQSTNKGDPTDEGTGISVVPAGAAVSTMRDLARFAGALMSEGACANGAIVAPETLASMYELQDVGALSGDVAQGLQFAVDLDGAATDGVWTVGHGGDTLLQHARLFVAPDEELAVIVLTQEATAGGLASTVALEAMRDAIGARRGADLPPVPERSDVDPHAAEKDELDALEGLYGTSIGVAEVKRKGDGLRLEVGGTTVRLVPTAIGTFRARPIVLGVRLPILLDGLELRFATVDGVDVLQLAGDPGRYATQGARIADAGELDSWRPAVGPWVPAEVRAADALQIERAELEDHGDHLRLVVRVVTPLGEDDQDWVLVPLDAERARLGGIGRGLGGVVTLKNGVLSGFGLSFVPEDS